MCQLALLLIYVVYVYVCVCVVCVNEFEFEFSMCVWIHLKIERENSENFSAEKNEKKEKPYTIYMVNGENIMPYISICIYFGSFVLALLSFCHFPFCKPILVLLFIAVFFVVVAAVCCSKFIRLNVIHLNR